MARSATSPGPARPARCRLRSRYRRVCPRRPRAREFVGAEIDAEDPCHAPSLIARLRRVRSPRDRRPRPALGSFWTRRSRASRVSAQRAGRNGGSPFASPISRISAGSKPFRGCHRDLRLLFAGHHGLEAQVLIEDLAAASVDLACGRADIGVAREAVEASRAGSRRGGPSRWSSARQRERAVLAVARRGSRRLRPSRPPVSAVRAASAARASTSPPRRGAFR